MGAQRGVSDYLPILTMIVLVAIFASASFAASILLGPRRPTAAKEAPYECGIVPEGNVVERFPVKFYLVAMTFIVLDVEIIFLYPFMTILRDFAPAWYGLIAMGVFLLVLLVPFAYLLSTGALDWAPLRSLGAKAGAAVLKAAGHPGAQGLDPADAGSAAAARRAEGAPEEAAA
jgi:NADH-quinone oxidoreductase subunit A